MGESTEMNDPLAGTLSRLTPTTTGFDRDSLLFAAGRASVRSPRIWPAMVGILLIGQAVTLVLFVNRPDSQGVTILVKQTERPTSIDPGSSKPPPVDSKQWADHRAMLTGRIDDLPPVAPQMFESNQEPVWTVLSFSTLNLDD